MIPVGLSVLIGLAVFFLTWLIFKKTYFAALLSSALMFCFFNFALLRRAAASLPVIREHEIWGALVFSAIILALSFFLLYKANKKEDIIRKISLVFIFVISGLIIFNTVLAFPSIIKRSNAGKDSEKYVETVNSQRREDFPNIYYFILDEYGTFECLNKYYGYPNSDFYNYLIDKGFSVSQTSSNRSTHTKFCIAEDLNLDYVCNEDMIKRDYLKLIDNADWFYIMNDLGYSQYSLSTQIDMFPIPDLDKVQDSDGLSRKFQKLFTGETEGGENIFSLSYKNTVLFSVFGANFLEPQTEEGMPIDRVGRVKWVLDYYEDFGADDVGNGKMIISYICSPHVPFAYDENGDRQPEEEKYNWSDPQYYLGQLKYVTKRMQVAIDNILTYDPSAIIIMQSDHGFRNHKDDADPKVNMPFEMESGDNKRILNAVYFAGEEVDIEGLSGPNTLRVVLTKMGLDYPLLENTK